MYKRTFGYSNMCSSVQNHKIKLWFKGWVLVMIHHALNIKEIILVLKKNIGNFLIVKRWYGERLMIKIWQVYQNYRSSNKDRIHKDCINLNPTFKLLFRMYKSYCGCPR